MPATVRSLISDLQRLLLSKRYLQSLKEKFQWENRRISHLRGQLDELNERIESAERNLIGKFIPGIRERKVAEAEALRASFLEKSLELQESEALVRLQQFEMDVLRDKIARENELRQALNEAIREKRPAIESGDSVYLKRLSAIYEKLDDRLALQQEIDEIRAAGDSVIEIIDKIDLQLKHNLIRTYETQKYGGREDEAFYGFSITSRKVIKEVMQHAKKLEERLASFQRELSDVYDDQDVRLAYQHNRLDYYNAIAYAKTIAWEINQSIVTQQHRHPLRHIVQHIEQINALFLNERDFLEDEISELSSEKDELLKSGGFGDATN